MTDLKYLEGTIVGDLIRFLEDEQRNSSGLLNPELFLFCKKCDNYKLFTFRPDKENIRMNAKNPFKIYSNFSEELKEEGNELLTSFFFFSAMHKYTMNNDEEDEDYNFNEEINKDSENKSSNIRRLGLLIETKDDKNLHMFKYIYENKEFIGFELIDNEQEIDSASFPVNFIYENN